MAPDHKRTQISTSIRCSSTDRQRCVVKQLDRGRMLSREEFSEKRKYLSYSERIIFFIDESHEMLTSGWDQQKSWKEAIQDLLRILMGRKLNTSLYSHEFCLLSYNSLSEVRLLHPFSRSMNSLQEVVLFPEGDGQRLNVNNENLVPDFGIIFQQADQLLSQQSPEQQKSQISPSNYLNRCIVIYGRSEQVPSYSMNLFHPSTASYLSSFFVDIVFIHRKLSTPEMAHQCQSIFDKLSTIQHELTAHSTSTSALSSSQQQQPESHLCQNNYIFEIPPSTLRLLTVITALLCHPFQRDHQANYFQKLEVTTEMMETMATDVESYHKAMIAQQASAQAPGGTDDQLDKNGNSSSSSISGGNGNGCSSSNPSTPSSKKLSTGIKNMFSKL